MFTLFTGVHSCFPIFTNLLVFTFVYLCQSLPLYTCLPVLMYVCCIIFLIIAAVVHELSSLLRFPCLPRQ